MRIKVNKFSMIAHRLKILFHELSDNSDLKTKMVGIFLLNKNGGVNIII